MINMMTMMLMMMMILSLNDDDDDDDHHCHDVDIVDPPILAAAPGGLKAGWRVDCGEEKPSSNLMSPANRGGQSSMWENAMYTD